LQTAGAADVMIFNRTAGRAERLADELGARAVSRVESADIVIQCTSAELQGDEPFKRALADADTFGAGTCVVDMAYRAGGTAFLAAARKCGADVVDGLEVLVAQGAASLERWTGRPAPHDVMRQAVQDPRTA
jgi:shikimate dehydrogenase